VRSLSLILAGSTFRRLYRRTARNGVLCLIGIAGLLVASCSNTRVITYDQNFVATPADFIVYDAPTPYVRTVIAGNPFRVSEQRTAQATTEAMARARPGYDLRYTTSEQVISRRHAYMSVFLNPDRPLTTADLCSGCCRSFTDPDRRPIKVAIALCQADRPLAAVRGHVSGAESPEDAEYRALIEEMVHELYEPVRRGRQRFPDAI